MSYSGKFLDLIKKDELSLYEGNNAFNVNKINANNLLIFNAINKLVEQVNIINDIKYLNTSLTNIDLETVKIDLKKILINLFYPNYPYNNTTELKNNCSVIKQDSCDLDNDSDNCYKKVDFNLERCGWYVVELKASAGQSGYPSNIDWSWYQNYSCGGGGVAFRLDGTSTIKERKFFLAGGGGGAVPGYANCCSAGCSGDRCGSYQQGGGGSGNRNATSAKSNGAYSGGCCNSQGNSRPNFEKPFLEKNNLFQYNWLLNSGYTKVIDSRNAVYNGYGTIIYVPSWDKKEIYNTADYYISIKSLKETYGENFIKAKYETWIQVDSDDKFHLLRKYYLSENEVKRILSINNLLQYQIKTFYSIYSDDTLLKNRMTYNYGHGNNGATNYNWCSCLNGNCKNNVAGDGFMSAQEGCNPGRARGSNGGYTICERVVIFNYIPNNNLNYYIGRKGTQPTEIIIYRLPTNEDIIPDDLLLYTITENGKTFAGLKNINSDLSGFAVLKLIENCFATKKTNLLNNSAFQETGMVKNVILTNVEVIMPSSFEDIKSIEYITISNYIKEIGDYAFKNTNIKLVKKETNLFYLHKIGIEAFFGCKKQNTYICNNLSNLQSIGDYAFYDNDGQTNLDLKCVNIGNSVFEENSTLREVYLRGINSIGNNCFKDCNNLLNVVFDDTNTLTLLPDNCFYTDGLDDRMEFDFSGFNYKVDISPTTFNAIKVKSIKVSLGLYSSYYYASDWLYVRNKLIFENSNTLLFASDLVYNNNVLVGFNFARVNQLTKEEKALIQNILLDNGTTQITDDAFNQLIIEGGTDLNNCRIFKITDNPPYPFDIGNNIALYSEFFFILDNMNNPSNFISYITEKNNLFDNQLENQNIKYEKSSNGIYNHLNNKLLALNEDKDTGLPILNDNEKEIVFIRDYATGIEANAIVDTILKYIVIFCDNVLPQDNPRNYPATLEKIFVLNNQYIPYLESYIYNPDADKLFPLFYVEGDYNGNNELTGITTDNPRQNIALLKENIVKINLNSIINPQIDTLKISNTNVVPIDIPTFYDLEYINENAFIVAFNASIDPMNDFNNKLIYFSDNNTLNLCNVSEVGYNLTFTNESEFEIAFNASPDPMNDFNNKKIKFTDNNTYFVCSVNYDGEDYTYILTEYINFTYTLTPQTIDIYSNIVNIIIPTAVKADYEADTNWKKVFEGKTIIDY